MKRFIMRCAVLLAVTAALLYVGGAAYRLTAHYRNIEAKEDTDTFHAVPNQIDLAVLGASHGLYSFRFFPAGVTYFNFSLPSQSLQYDEKMVLEYGNHFHPGTVVLLTISYRFPFEIIPESYFESRQGRYYRILSPQNIVDADPLRWALQRFSPLLTEDASVVIRAFLKPEQPVTDSEAEERFSPSDADKEIERIRQTHIARIVPVFPDTNQVMMEALRGILSMCAKRGWTAVLVTPPYPSVYNQCFETGFDPDFFDVFYGIVDELSSAYQVPYLDYSHDARFTEAPELFMDIDHLNEDGARLFDTIFFEDLRKIGIDLTAAGQEENTE